MKKTIMLFTLAASGMAVLPLHAETAVAEPAVEAQATATVAAYIVQVSGKG